MRFVVEYATSSNGRRSAINAGYSPKVAGVMACRLLKNEKVMDALKGIRDKDARKLKLTREKVLQELARGLFRDPIGLQNAEGFVVTDLREVPVELRTIIDGFEVTQDLARDEDGVLHPVSQKIKIKLVPKANVTDMAMKHFGAYAAEKQITKVGVDWDSLYGPSPITDPADDAIKQIEEDE
jgi:phage terminase small subunit